MSHSPSHRPPRRRVPAFCLALAGILAAACGRAPADDPAPAPAVEPAASTAPDPEAAPATLADRRELIGPATGERLEAYAALRAKTVGELQPLRRSTTGRITAGAGQQGEATLTDLNPRIAAWWLLELAWDDGRGKATYHLENSDPEHTEILLDPGFPEGLVLRSGGRDEPCQLWSGAGPTALEQARAAAVAYAPLCGGRLFLRGVVQGRRSNLERATDLLRDHVRGGEQITVFVREKLYQDAFLETAELIAPKDPAAPRRPRPPGAPDRPRIDPRYDGYRLATTELGITLEDVRGEGVAAGRWYAAANHDGVFLSTLSPRLVAAEVATAQGRRVNPLDDVEIDALVYLVAVDLAHFELGFALGTEHPRVDWSERAAAGVRPSGMPGPDGIASAAPLVRTGQLSPDAAQRVEATFVGGFKRSHGAFKHGALASLNRATHYGFIEQGMILSKLQPGLATVVIWEDGTVELATWSAANDARLSEIRHARQNGVPILEPDPATGEVVPGALLTRWGEGNWSGSADKKLRSLRAGLCLQEGRDGRYLIYGYFSSATPSAMARVFGACGCSYAMLLDMNALEHSYLALYRTAGDRFLTEHLIDGMEVLDRKSGDQELPRFVAIADNRDFFYLSRKEPADG